MVGGNEEVIWKNKRETEGNTHMKVMKRFFINSSFEVGKVKVYFYFIS